MKKRKLFIDSGGKKVFVEIAFPDKLPANAVIVAHGFSSFYRGFLDTFAKRIFDRGYITVKFHFVGTGKSDGRFEDKLTGEMLRNYSDVLEYVKSMTEVKGIGVVARSNAGNLVTLHGPDPRVKAYVFLAPSAYYSDNIKAFLKRAELRKGYYYHKGLKRAHTKGEGRLPESFLAEAKSYDRLTIRNMKKMKPVIFFQSVNDESVPVSGGHFDCWKKNLPQPNKFYLVESANHSFKGHKKFVIAKSVDWLHKYLR